jgi:hypothetical protein
MAKSLEKLPTDELEKELRRRERAAHRLVAKRERLLSQIAEIDAELADFGYEAGGAPSGTNGRRGGRKRPKNEMSLVEALEKALKGKTMGVSEAADAAQNLGYRSSSANFRNIVNQTLLKHTDVFKKVGRGQYTLKK